MWLARISIRQPVLISMVLAAIMLTGYGAYQSMPVDLFPDVNFPVVSITTTLPGASPEEMENQVTKPIEEAVTSLANVEKITSTSTEGLSTVLVQFDLGYPIEDGAAKVREELDRVRPRLPEDASDPLLLRFDPTAQPILVFGLADTSGAMSPRELRTFVDDTVRPRLERVNGVGQVVVTGGQEREVRVLLNLDAVRARGLTVNEITAALRNQNLTVPGGRLNGPSQEVLVKTEGQFQSVEDIARTVLATRNGVPVQVRDVATVEDGAKDTRQYNRLNGNESVILTVRKQSGANTVRAAEEVVRTMEELRRERPELDTVLILDQSESIKESNNDVMLALVLGGFAASLVVFMFFRDVRNTLVTVAGLPVIILGTFLVINLLGYGINMMTLMALSLSIGLLIDDAIVVRENIFRHMERGADPHTAALEGTGEIAFAVIATSLSILAVFVPVAFATGIIGQFFRQFGITVAVAVAISMFEAFTLAPLLSAYFFHRLERKDGEEMAGRGRSLVNVYQRFADLYLWLLRWALRRRWTMAGIAVGVFVFSMFLGAIVGKQFFGAQDTGQFVMSFQLEPGAPLAETDFTARQIEAYLLQRPEVSDVYVRVGGAGASESATVSVKLKERGHTEAFVARVRERFEGVPNLAFSNQSVGGNSGSSAITARTMLLSISGGERVADLEPISAALEAKLASIGGLVDVDRSYRPGRPELRVAVDRDRAADVGASAAAVAGTVRTLLAGDVVTRFRDGENEWDVLVQLREQDRSRLNDILALQVPTSRGGTVPLGAVATLREAQGPTQIDREDRAPRILVGGNVKGRPESEVRAEVVAAIQELQLPPGVRVAFAGTAQTSNESFASLSASLGLAIVFLYMVLGSQFGSFIHPLTIMTSLPMAFGGAFAALLLANKNLDVMAMIGIIFLMGLVTKNAILLIDFVIRARRAGMPRTEALVQAGAQRLRPILMTTLAMMAGMLPTALALSEGSEWRAAMGITVIGGLVTSTLLTLLVVPVFYTFFDDLPRALGRGGRFLRGGWRRRSAAAAGAPAGEWAPEREPVATH